MAFSHIRSVCLMTWLAGIGWMSTAYAGPVPGSGGAEEQSPSADRVTWNAWAQRVAARPSHPQRAEPAREAWWRLLSELEPGFREEVVAVLDAAGGATAATSRARRRWISALDDRSDHPVFPLLALRLRADESALVGSKGAAARAPTEGLLSACRRHVGLLGHSDPVVVVLYVASCAGVFSVPSPYRVVDADALAAAASRVPATRWSRPFWIVVRDEALRRGDREALLRALATVVVLEGRACEDRCELRLGAAVVVEVQRSVLGCLEVAERFGPVDLATSTGPFAACLSVRLPRERQQDVVWIHELPFE